MADHEDEEHAHCVSTADDGVLEGEQIAKGEQPPLERRKRRSPGDQGDGHGGNRQMQDLHGDRIMCEACHAEEAEIPERRVPVIPHVPEQFAHRKGVSRHAPGLRLIEPYWMTSERKTDREQIGNDQCGW